MRDDIEAFEELVVEHLSVLRARAARMCRGVGDPDDLVQDALMRALRARHQMRSPARARGWLLSIVSSTFIDGVRRRRVRPREVALDVDPLAPEAEPPPAWTRVSADALHAAVARLPDDVRETFRLFAIEGRDYVAIAAATGVAKSTVGTRILRARRHMRALLEADLGAEAAL